MKVRDFGPELVRVGYARQDVLRRHSSSQTELSDIKSSAIATVLARLDELESRGADNAKLSTITARALFKYCMVGSAVKVSPPIKLSDAEKVEGIGRGSLVARFRAEQPAIVTPSHPSVNDGVVDGVVVENSMLVVSFKPEDDTIGGYSVDTMFRQSPDQQRRRYFISEYWTDLMLPREAVLDTQWVAHMVTGKPIPTPDYYEQGRFALESAMDPANIPEAYTPEALNGLLSIELAGS